MVFAQETYGFNKSIHVLKKSVKFDEKKMSFSRALAIVGMGENDLKTL